MSDSDWDPLEGVPEPRQIVEVREGEFVFKEGDLGTEMYIVHEGQVEVFHRTGDLGETQHLAILEQGDFFGEMSLLEDMPRSASVRAVCDTKLIWINGATFDQMLRSNPEIAVRMMRKLSRRLRETERRLAEFQGSAAALAAESPSAPAAEAAEEGPEHLTHRPSGMVFYLPKGREATIGRKDAVTGIHPDVDLTPVDSQRSSSRRHAKVYCQGGKYFVAEEIGTMNGTFVNGTRIQTGIPAEVKSGDSLRFGLVELEFSAQ